MSHALEASPISFSTPSRLRLFLKYLMWPGSNWVSRDKSHVVKMFLNGTADAPIRTLDCGCGNAFFAHQAVLKGAVCTGITIHDWEWSKCEEMRRYLNVPEDRMAFVVSSLERFADDRSREGKYDQVLLLDVIEHILDADATLTQLNRLLDDDGFVYITTPNRDWQGNASKIRVTPTQDGWHVRNGYTIEQLEQVLDRNGFEPIDHMRYGNLGSTVVTWIQHNLFRSLIDPLTVALFPVLKFAAFAFSPWRDPHTIFVLARKKRTV